MVDLSSTTCMFLPGQLSDLQPSGQLPEVAISAPIEEYAVRVPPVECNDRPKPGVVAFRRFVLEHLGGADSGICRGCGGQPASSEHNEGRAWDWQVQATKPDDVARVEQLFDWLFATDLNGNAEANFRRAGLRYIIWDRQIWSSQTRQWKPYTGKSPHRDHVHFTFSWPGALGETSFYDWLSGNAPPGPPRPGPGGAKPLNWQPAVALALGAALGYWGAGYLSDRWL